MGAVDIDDACRRERSEDRCVRTSFEDAVGIADGRIEHLTMRERVKRGDSRLSSRD